MAKFTDADGDTFEVKHDDGFLAFKLNGGPGELFYIQDAEALAATILKAAKKIRKKARQ